MRLLNELSRQQKTRTAVISTGQFNGAGEESRTPDLRITNALLYQLSYTGISRSPKLVQPRDRRSAIMQNTLHADKYY